MSLEKARLKLEIKKMETAKEELEFKVLERQEDIKRLNGNIELQAQAIAKKIDELSIMEG